MRSAHTRPLVIAAACALWLAAAALGMLRLSAYANTPGPAARASGTWPAAAQLPREQHLPTLVMFVHPECACSAASVEELALLMARAQGRAVVHVLVYRPEGVAAGWERGGLWTAAARIPGVRVSTDADATQAALFGVFVSGQTLLYDENGRLLFSGGITFARGHAGENEGRRALTAALNGGALTTTRTPVFGCFLRQFPSA